MTKEEIEAELKGQLTIVSGYISKIELNKWTIDDVRNALYSDLEYLQQEFGVLQTNKIISK